MSLENNMVSMVVPAMVVPQLIDSDQISLLSSFVSVSTGDQISLLSYFVSESTGDQISLLSSFVSVPTVDQISLLSYFVSVSTTDQLSFLFSFVGASSVCLSLEKGLFTENLYVLHCLIKISVLF